MRTLNEIMEFDHVIQVLDDGIILERVEGVWAPDLYDCHLSQLSVDPQWSLLSGYSGQHNYSGPIMHQSEFIGGRMEEHIRATPGYWVKLVNIYLDDSEPDSWAVAYRPSW